MQDEINKKVIALYIKGGKISKAVTKGNPDFPCGDEKAKSKAAASPRAAYETERRRFQY